MESQNRNGKKTREFGNLRVPDPTGASMEEKFG